MEYYIRRNEEEDARGPFTLEQLTSLADAGQVDLETTYYDANSEQWVMVSANDQLRSTLFPEKKRIKLKPRENVSTLNTVSPFPTAQPPKSENPIEIEHLLAAAEGRTPESRSGRDPRIELERAAGLGLRLLGLAFLLSAAALALPDLEVVLGLNPLEMAARPLVWFAAFDLVMGMLILLGVADAYPLVRLRAAFGIGFLGFYFWSFGAPQAVLAVTLGSLGLYALTLTATLPLVLAAGVLALGGLGWLAAQFLR